MPKKTRLRRMLIVCTVILSIVVACKKSDDGAEPEKKDPGLFIATQNGLPWTANLHKAMYVPKWHQLYLYASGEGSDFALGIQLDSNQLIKSYPILSHGSNVAELTKNKQAFASDFNLADIGGHFTLTALDTIGKKLSGQLQVTMYTGDRLQKLVLASNSITDIPVEMDTSSYPGSYISCTVTGATSSIWEARDVSARVSCVTDKKYQQLEVTFNSLLLFTRNLTFYLPLENEGLPQSIYPREIPYIYCGWRQTTAQYEVRQAEKYISSSGSFTITKMDTIAGSLDASFNLVLKDTTARGGQLQMTNGKIHIARYHKN